ncbi:peptidoglycan binding domain-containing protein [Nocardioides cynanchi]|uniref:peptidoglycan binding domain-containing protein n=1 Tax=Nocardioides cynanchi TaxID=2558918 RepID=UPI00177F3344|nr:peptidoglycan binding domain-containing protein [Nocardioides cynanchi]
MARSTRRDDRPVRESEGGRVVLLLILGLAMLAGGLYVVAYLGASDKVPVGTRIGGVDVGGHSPGTAVDVLREGLHGRARTPFTVTIGGRTQQVRPREAGLSVDYVASVRQATGGRGWSPSRLWTYYTSGGEFDPVVNLDQQTLQELLTRLDETDGRPPADARVRFGKDGFSVVAPRAGLSIDPKAAAGAFWNAFLTERPEVALPMTPTTPAIDSNALHQFVRRFANPAVSGPVQLRFGTTTLRLQPSSYCRFLGSVTEGHHLRPTVHAGSLARTVHARLRQSGPVDTPVDATVTLVNGRPHVVPGRPGVTFTPPAVGHALLRAIASPQRVARVAASVAPAKFTAADARRLGIRHQISTFSVHLRRGHPSADLAAAAARLDQTVLRPGRSFSLRARLGGGVPGDAAGTSLATGLFNAAWLGGLQIGSHANLLSYTGDYPVGRDASVADGQDVAFTDDTSYGVLVSVAVASPSARHGGSLTVSLWSTPTWDVVSSHAAPTAVVPAGRIVRHGSGCRARAGRDGFDTDVTRTFARPGSSTVDHRGSYAVHYVPVAAVVCKGRHG